MNKTNEKKQNQNAKKEQKQNKTKINKKNTKLTLCTSQSNSEMK